MWYIDYKNEYLIFFIFISKMKKKAGFDIIKCNILIWAVICLDTNNRNGDSYEIIAKRLDTPVKSVDNAIQRIRKKAIKNLF